MKKSMKRIAALLTAVILLAVGMAGCSGAGGNPAAPADQGQNSGETYTFTCANFYATVNNNSLLVEDWINEIATRSNGRIQFEYYPGGSLVSAANSYDSVVNGVVDIAMTATANTPGLFQAMSYLELPQGYPDGYVGTMVANDFVNQFELDEFSSVKLLYTHTVSPLVILGNKEIRSLGDVKGTIIRTGSDLATDTVQALGGQSYSCQITELYEALVKGIVDGAISGKDTLEGFGLSEVCKYVIDDPSYGKLGAVVMIMNPAKWSALPEDLQQIMTEVSVEFAEKHAKGWKYDDIVAYNQFEAKGGEIIKLAPEASAEFTEKLQPVNQAYIDGLDKLTDEQVAEYSGYIQERIAYWSAQEPSEEEITSWYDEYLAPLAKES